MANTEMKRRLWAGAGSDTMLPLATLMIVVLMVVPVPAMLLDVGFISNIMISLAVLMVALNASKPLDFSSFPTVLLFTPLLRLALNVASTRVVLVNGHTGAAAAGHVIEAFGSFLIGGDYAVGIFVFVILMIINLVVITKGAGRISEVSARFTLDAMTGKQMAIDADLNAGLITQAVAKQRRKEVSQEADFYGSMDGASKFVRGDAIAGILILFINLIGGLIIGMLQHGMTFGNAMHNYSLLTIGDGLVAQVPSLVLSTAAALMVTRVTSSEDMGRHILGQLFANPKSLIVTSGVLGAMGVIPGMPNLVFLSLAAGAGAGAYYVARRNKTPVEEVQPELPPPVVAEPKELGWDDVQPVDTVGLEVGYRLIPLVDKNQGGQLMTRIKGVR